MTHSTTRPATAEHAGGAEHPRVPHLFLVLECKHASAAGARWSLANISEVAIGRGLSRAFTREGRTLRIQLPDERMSSRHARILCTAAGFEVVDDGSMNGTFVDGERTIRGRVRDGAVIELGSSMFLLRHELPTPRDEPAYVDGAVLANHEPGLATLVPTWAEALARLARVAMSDVPILLIGESGTGKEVLAHAVHTISARKGAFVAVNCGALPEALVEGQLFGHAKGAFSGAVRDEIGLVRASDGGTLFLDEIGDLPKTSQAALLRVLQEREVMPVGATRPLRVDLRVVAATHQRVEQLHTTGHFRSDLYARLAGFTFELSPLRARKEDLGVLIAAIVQKLSPGREITLSRAVGAALLRYDWPLNVRELQQALSVALALAGDANPATLSLAQLPEPVRRPPEKADGPNDRRASDSRLSVQDENVRSALDEALRRTRGNVTVVAREMGKTRMQIHRWMKRYGIHPEEYRRRGDGQ